MLHATVRFNDNNGLVSFNGKAAALLNLWENKEVMIAEENNGLYFKPGIEDGSWHLRVNNRSIFIIQREFVVHWLDKMKVEGPTTFKISETPTDDGWYFVIPKTLKR